MGLVDDADDVQIPLVGQLMVQAADDVQLGGAAALGLGGAVQDLLVGHHVALGALQVGPESAEGAAIDADVGRVEVRVDVVIGEVAVLALADEVGQLAEREQVGLLVEKDAVVERQPLARLDLGADVGQSCIGVELDHDSTCLERNRGSCLLPTCYEARGGFSSVRQSATRGGGLPPLG